MLDSTTLHPCETGSVAGKTAPLVKVTNTGGVLSLVAAQRIEAERLLFRIEGKVTDRPSRYSVQIGRDLHIELPSPQSAHELELLCERHPWRFLNHGCEPSARIAGLEVFARRDIAAGEQVTFDYDTTEWEMAEAFRCHCGAASCRGEIRGYKFLSPEARAHLGEAAAKYLRRI